LQGSVLGSVKMKPSFCSYTRRNSFQFITRCRDLAQTVLHN
jgi:hypothetical protein